jgi:hypothetical protein
MHTEREYLVRRIDKLDNLLEHLQQDVAGDHTEFRSAIQSLLADDVRRLNELDDADGAT